jgi:histidyl-tRNA synthetase
MIKYSEELTSFYENKKHLLSEDSLNKLKNNPLDLFKINNENEKILAKNAPSIIKFLKKDSKNHYAKFKEYLELLGVPFEEDNTLVLDENYYTSSMWTINNTKTNNILAL